MARRCSRNRGWVIIHGSDFRGVVHHDAVLPVKICGKACLTWLVSGSMVSFRQKSEVVLGRMDCFGTRKWDCGKSIVLSVNTEDSVFPALGHYQEKITFYWNSEAGYDWPVLVIWLGEFAAHCEYGEVLFSAPAEPWEGETGELLFEFISLHNNDDIISEFRWWYKDGELLQSTGRTSCPDELVEFTPDAPGEFDFAHRAVDLIELFYLIH